MYLARAHNVHKAPHFYIFQLPHSLTKCTRTVSLTFLIDLLVFVSIHPIRVQIWQFCHWWFPHKTGSTINVASNE